MRKLCSRSKLSTGAAPHQQRTILTLHTLGLARQRRASSMRSQHRTNSLGTPSSQAPQLPLRPLAHLCVCPAPWHLVTTGSKCCPETPYGERGNSRSRETAAAQRCRSQHLRKQLTAVDQPKCLHTSQPAARLPPSPGGSLARATSRVLAPQGTAGHCPWGGSGCSTTDRSGAEEQEGFHQPPPTPAAALGTFR